MTPHILSILILSYLGFGNSLQVKNRAASSSEQNCADYTTNYNQPEYSKMKDTFILNEDIERFSDYFKECIIGRPLKFTSNNQPFSGILKVVKNGQVQRVQGYVNGIPNGVWRKYKNGSLIAEVPFNDGFVDGKYFEIDGGSYLEATFHHGYPQGKFIKRYDADKTLYDSVTFETKIINPTVAFQPFTKFAPNGGHYVQFQRASIESIGGDYFNSPLIPTIFYPPLNPYLFLHILNCDTEKNMIGGYYYASEYTSFKTYLANGEHLLNGRKEKWQNGRIISSEGHCFEKRKFKYLGNYFTVEIYTPNDCDSLSIYYTLSTAINGIEGENERHGEYIYYSPDMIEEPLGGSGDVTISYNYVSGQYSFGGKSGIWKYYRKEGNSEFLVRKTPFKTIPVYPKLLSNSNTKCMDTYKFQGVKDGIEEIYDANGKVLYTFAYKNDQRVRN